jgi:gamma-glutamylcyclotransferase (GGCT)/AIG2-like uncharacterized protein YtfP
MKLFVYGTLNDGIFLESILGKRMKFTPDSLLNFCQDSVFIDGEFYPNIYHCQGGIIEGNLILDLSESDFKKLDLYEGPKYRRVQVRLKSGVLSQVYISD